MTQTIPITESSQLNFNTLIDAVRKDRICLMSVFDSKMNISATLICAANIHDGVEPYYEFIPLAVLCDEDPYARFIPPLSEPDVCDGQ